MPHVINVQKKIEKKEKIKIELHEKQMEEKAIRDFAEERAIRDLLKIGFAQDQKQAFHLSFYDYDGFLYKVIVRESIENAHMEVLSKKDVLVSYQKNAFSNWMQNFKTQLRKAPEKTMTLFVERKKVGHHFAVGKIKVTLGKPFVWLPRWSTQ